MTVTLFPSKLRNSSRLRPWDKNKTKNTEASVFIYKFESLRHLFMAAIKTRAEHQKQRETFLTFIKPELKLKTKTSPIVPL